MNKEIIIGLIITLIGFIIIILTFFTNFLGIIDDMLIFEFGVVIFLIGVSLIALSFFVKMKKWYWIIGFLIVIILIVYVFYLSSLTCFGFSCPPAAIVNQNSAKSAACYIVMEQNHDCQLVDTTTIVFYRNEKVPEFDANKDRTINSSDTFQELCETYFGVSKGNQVDCRKICGCVS